MNESTEWNWSRFSETIHAHNEKYTSNHGKLLSSSNLCFPAPLLPFPKQWGSLLLPSNGETGQQILGCQHSYYHLWCLRVLPIHAQKWTLQVPHRGPRARGEMSCIGRVQCKVSNGVTRSLLHFRKTCLTTRRAMVRREKKGEKGKATSECQRSGLVCK